MTGSAGFIGSHIVAALGGAGHDVIGFDLHQGQDVRDRSAIEAALAGVEVVCHQAAKVGLGVDLDDLPDYASHNDVGTAVLLAAMARQQVRRLILAGSMVVYGEGRYRCGQHGDVPAPPREVRDLDAGSFEPRCPQCRAALAPDLVSEDAPLDPRNAYAATKVAQEHLAAAWARASQGSALVLRYHNVYGPGMPRDTAYAGVASLFAAALARGEAPQVFEDGGQRRDFVHVRDVARANLAAAAVVGERQWRVFNIGSGQVRTVLDLADALARSHGGPAPVVTGAYRLGDVRHITASSDRAAAELGWAAAEPFDSGVRELWPGS